MSDEIVTQEIRDEFGPAHGSRLAIKLNALDSYRAERDELRPEFEQLRDEVNDTKRRANDSSLPVMEQAEARSRLPILREARSEAQVKYERMRGKARNLEGDIAVYVRKLRRFKDELSEIAEYKAEVESAGGEWSPKQQAGLYRLPYQKATEAAQRERKLSRYMANWLEPNESAQRTQLGHEYA